LSSDGIGLLIVAVSKKIRFEVFKRDKFACQYCGREAPEIVLQVDHVVPKAESGSDDLMNLVTSCVDCNQGKGPRLLDDDSVVTRQRAQVELLQERKEQIDMMIAWKRSLEDLDLHTVDQAAEFWCDLVGWYDVNKVGRQDLWKLIRRHGLDVVLDAMRAAQSYVKLDKDGNPTVKSMDCAFSKVSGICRMAVADQEKPWLKDLLYIRSILTTSRRRRSDRVSDG
jgi:hypothetical protein